MHGTPFSRITILFAVCMILLCQGVFGQKKADGEVDAAKCWSYSLGDSSGRLIVADESRVFVGLDGAKIEALSRDGTKIWSSEFGGEISSNILVTDRNLFFVTSAVSGETAKSGTGRLLWVSKDTGITNWTVALPDADRYYLGSFNGAVIALSRNGAIESIDVNSGSVNWKRQVDEKFAAEPSFAQSSVMVATIGKRIFNVSFKSGEINWMRKFPFAVTALSAAENGELIVGDERGHISALNGADKPIWMFRAGGEISNFLRFDGNVLAASHDNFIYFLLSRNGGRIWKRRLTGRAGQIAMVPEHYALVSTFEERGAVLTDMLNGRIAGRIAFGDNESPAVPPVVANGLIFVLTNKAVYGYSLSGCPPEK